VRWQSVAKSYMDSWNLSCVTSLVCLSAFSSVLWDQLSSNGGLVWLLSVSCHSSSLLKLYKCPLLKEWPNQRAKYTVTQFKPSRNQFLTSELSYLLTLKRQFTTDTIINFRSSLITSKTRLCCQESCTESDFSSNFSVAPWFSSWQPSTSTRIA